MNLPTCQEPEIVLESTLGQRVQEQIHALGLEIPTRPQGTIPELPPDLTNVVPATMSFLIGVYATWATFIGPQVAIARSEASDFADKAKWALKIDKDLKMSLRWAQKQTERKAYADVLEQLYKAVLKKRDACSREISRISGGMPEPIPQGPRQ